MYGVMYVRLYVMVYVWCDACAIVCNGAHVMLMPENVRLYVMVYVWCDVCAIVCNGVCMV